MSGMFFRACLFMKAILRNGASIGGVLVFPLVSLAALASGEFRYTIQTWDRDNGLPQAALTAVVQTPDGYLWIGSNNGLLRFDGERFVVLDPSNTPGLHSGRIRSLAASERGALLIGYEDGAVDELSQGRVSLRSAPFGMTPYSGVLAVGEDGSGRVWAVRTAAAVRDHRGQLWVARLGLLTRLGPDGETHFPLKRNWEVESVSAIGAAQRGGLWMMHEGHFRRWEDGRWLEDWGVPPWDSDIRLLLVELRDGTIAAGREDGGLILWRPGEGSQFFDVDHGLPHRQVRGLVEDAEGNLWVATGGGGLAMLRRAALNEISPPEGWGGRTVLSVAPASGGGVWVGTEGGGLYRMQEGAWMHFGLESGLQNLYLWALAENHQGELRVGTWGGGLFHGSMEAGFKSDFRLPPSLPVLAILEAKDANALWVGTRAGLCGWKGERLLVPVFENRFEDVRSLALDGNGDLWFGVLGGGVGVRRADGRFERWTQADGLSSDLIYSVLPDAGGGLWIATAGGGLNHFKNGRFQSLTIKNGLPSNVIGRLIDDRLGYLWGSSSEGIFRVSFASLNDCVNGLTRSVECDVFGKSDGLPSMETTGAHAAACQTPDGNLWFCTSKGLVRVDPSRIPLNRARPRMAIESICADEQVFAPGEQTVVIAPGAKRVAIRYTGFHYAAPEKIRFRTRLTGLDDAWTDAEISREAVFLLLPPGAYQFEVLACGHDGVWASEPVAQRFVMRPFFWQTWWFRLLAFCMICVCAGWAMIAGSRMRMRRKLSEIEHRHSVERERSRIARDIHDDLGASLTRVTLLSQAALTETAAGRSGEAEISAVYATARELTRSMNEIVWAVNPKCDTMESMVNFLGKYAQDFLRAANLRCRLVVPAQLPLTTVSAEVRHHVFLAVKEALNNCVQHADCHEVKLVFTAVHGGFCLAVEDDGCGFCPDQAASSPVVGRGAGLANLRRRLADIGGSCLIQSVQGEGTRISLTFIPSKKAKAP
jgi:signal transduction histidine kinase/ligand-binding sensor domain-containing protein